MKYLKLYKENLKTSNKKISEEDSKRFILELKDLIPDLFDICDDYTYKYNYKTKKYTNYYSFITFDIYYNLIKKIDLIKSDLYRLNGILSNDYILSYSIDIRGYDYHDNISFKECIKTLDELIVDEADCIFLSINFDYL